MNFKYSEGLSFHITIELTGYFCKFPDEFFIEINENTSFCYLQTSF